MRFRDYLFFGQRVRLHSPLPAHTIAERINASTGKLWTPWEDDIVGRARPTRIALSRFIYLNGARPVLSGCLIEGPHGTDFNLIYRLRRRDLAFAVGWLLIGIILVPSLWAPGSIASTDPLLALLFSALFAAPTAVLCLGNWNSDKDLTQILAFLAQRAQAEPESQMQNAAP